ncbi:thioredoxin-dependent thiol peroxidase [Chryseobacterium indologenes]|uniref:thioredoxin-dependent peroxiredoxin n=2 Tax=Chryseobacterium indologenes TaxID=253 RepID=A0A5R9PVE1_CHRID|nr:MULTISPECIES: thioredoxin-dependent thiol peroxidase [Chryseobacterium]ATN07292.1 thioredoxin-dependent thiol peroxidase [Chryseobacterium indologenes]AYZ37776.1 thioredoxin-dependent thiol peroxidase [Chryseobacterium indologenes]AZB19022.1 thioredoxin-dependent thiol peroxidase [Chryseobacterium indologenes]MBF6646682.1 thioredoxin-dependent thiol peroxidase [Chryseobacterium indologenes]MBU3048972.1 thioredoxin-dependent thiol peroxidase [Chryseobacterium indologenes]
MLKVGDKLPEFEGLNQDGEAINSSKLIGKKLVVFFYPQASTPTCTVEACNLSDNYSKLKKAGFQLLGVSGDSIKKQKNFHSKFAFPYDLIADENRDIIEKFGVWKEKKTFGKTYMGIVRTTFIFDENGICSRVIEKVTSKTAADQILEG